MVEWFWVLGRRKDLFEESQDEEEQESGLVDCACSGGCGNNHKEEDRVA